MGNLFGVAGTTGDAVKPAAARTAVAPNWRVGAMYAFGAAAAACVAAAAWPWGAVALLPAGAMSCVALGYFGAGPAIFQKTAGKISLSARLVLWPCLVGHWAAFLYYRGRSRSCDHAAPGVWIGRRLSDAEAEQRVAAGVTAVLDLTAEFAEARPFRALTYRNIQVLDLTAPSLAQLESAAQFIAEQVVTGTVYVHCKIGYSRSAAAVGAYLLADGQAPTADEAVAMLRRARPGIVIRPEALAALRQFEALLNRDSGFPIRDSRSRTKGGTRDSCNRASRFADPLAVLARVICGSAPRWIGCEASTRQRIYFANHSSHLDFPVLWGSLPRRIRGNTRPVAARDYWDSNRLRRYFAAQVFHAVLIDRHIHVQPCDRQTTVAAARRAVEDIATSFGTDQSLIIFPEGSRGDDEEVRPFKSGLYHLCCLRPDVELVPTYLRNLNRILPKGEWVPAPVIASVTFGRPIYLEPGEQKDAFLARARSALASLKQS